jgi:hypothetical protein
MEIDRYYLSEHDEDEVNRRMKEQDRIAQEHQSKLLKPYIEALQGIRDVPRSELDPILDDAIVANIEGGKLGQRINENNEIVVYRKIPLTNP